ncbi:MAG: AAA-like domain-containing protein [Oculatellaceae cyanobacterium Prado106]|jgi:hypothetical protein|nr:AAA-like domain-containing protein [Oculatellaceae cyanobacterium Prado106]
MDSIASQAPHSLPAMNVEEALTLVEAALEPKHLNDLQQLVFCRSWAGQSYEEIAEELRYDAGYIRDVGSQLWHDLSDVLGDRVTKKSVQSALRRYQQEQQTAAQSTALPKKESSMALVSDVAIPESLEFPDGVVPLQSLFYVVRSPFEEQACAALHQPGSLVRIRAPRQMGKSSLMHRLVAHAKQSGFQTVSLNLQRAESSVLGSLEKFLRWFCANVSQQLGLPPQLETYWSADLGSKMSCTLYMQRYVLKNVDVALMLALDETNRLFEYPDMAMEFLPLLRSWYEDASEFEIWQKLRLVVVHSTEAYLPLNLNQSPFNVGLPLRLPEFSLNQVRDLADRHALTWPDAETEAAHLSALLNLVGGHPYLIRLALYEFAQKTLTLDQFLQEAPTATGIYGDHLRKLDHLLAENPKLAIALQQVLTNDPKPLETITTYQLESLGLIKLQGNQAVPSRELYRLYFQR